MDDTYTAPDPLDPEALDEGDEVNEGDHEDVDPEDVAGADSRWVAAAPFRAHLLRLVAESGLPWQWVGVQAGLSLTCASHLLFGHSGRRIRKISPATARGIWAVSPEELRGLATDFKPAAQTAARLRLLAERGYPAAALASEVGVPVEALTAITDRPEGHVPASVALAVRVAVAEFDAAAGLSALVA